MAYSCTDFVDSILCALCVEVPENDRDNPEAQADLALAEIARLQAAAAIVHLFANRRGRKAKVGGS
jgi:hypothetical protein